MECVLLFLNVALLQSVEIGIVQKERNRLYVGKCHTSMYCWKSNSSMETGILSHLCVAWSIQISTLPKAFVEYSLS